MIISIADLRYFGIFTFAVAYIICLVFYGRWMFVCLTTPKSAIRILPDLG